MAGNTVPPPPGTHLRAPALQVCGAGRAGGRTCATRSAPVRQGRRGRAALPGGTGGPSLPAWRGRAARHRQTAPVSLSRPAAGGPLLELNGREPGCASSLRLGVLNRTLGLGGGGGKGSQSSRDGSATMREAFFPASTSFKLH